MKSNTCKNSSSRSKPEAANAKKVKKVVKEDVKKPNKVEEIKCDGTLKQILYLLCGCITFIIITAIFVIAMTGCSYSINNVQTEGEASDVVDETQTNDPNIAPSLTVPIKL